jgi:predicted Zn-dependent peptidase
MSALMVSLLLAASPVVVTTATEPDGLDLVVATVASTRCSARLVVRVGAFDDPTGKAGLAHLVEHLVFGDPAAFALVNEGDGSINAFTSTAATTFVVDSSAARCAERLTALALAMSRGGFRSAWLAREQSVVLREQVYSSREQGFLENALFPTRSVLGTEVSRGTVTNEDVTRFFRAAYVPANMALVTVGPLDVVAVRAALEKGFALPPDGAAEQPERGAAVRALTLGKDREVVGAALGDFSGLRAMVAEVPREQLPECQVAAELLSLRLGAEGSTDRARAECLSMRGHLLLVTVVQNGSVSSSMLDEQQRQLADLRAATTRLDRNRELVVGGWALRRRQITGHPPTADEQRAFSNDLAAESLRLKRLVVREETLISDLEALIAQRKGEDEQGETRLERLWHARPVDALERKVLATRMSAPLAEVLDAPEALADQLGELAASHDGIALSTGWASWSAPDPKLLERLPAFLASLPRVTLVGH